MAKTYDLLTRDGYATVHYYTRIANRMKDVDGEWVDLEATVFDPRNFPDRKEQIIMLHVLRATGKKNERGRSEAWGPFSFNEVTDTSGMHRKTAQAKLESLEQRGILDYEPPKEPGKPAHVRLRLPLSRWQVTNIHAAKPIEQTDLVTAFRR